jgi:hypothetical protein
MGLIEEKYSKVQPTAVIVVIAEESLKIIRRVRMYALVIRIFIYSHKALARVE